MLLWYFSVVIYAAGACGIDVATSAEGLAEDYIFMRGLDIASLAESSFDLPNLAIALPRAPFNDTRAPTNGTRRRSQAVLCRRHTVRRSAERGDGRLLWAWVAAMRG